LFDKLIVKILAFIYLNFIKENPPAKPGDTIHHLYNH
jgi:hypothetical protein